MGEGTHKRVVVSGGVVMSLTAWLQKFDLTKDEYRHMVAKGMRTEQIEDYCATHTREERRLDRCGQPVNGALMTPTMIASALHMSVTKVYTYINDHAHNYQAAWDHFAAMDEKDRNRKHDKGEGMTDEEKAEKYAKKFGMVAKRKGPEERMHNVHGNEMTVRMVANHFGVKKDTVHNYMLNKGRSRRTLEQAFDHYHQKKLKERGIRQLRSTEKIVERIMRVI